METALVLCVPEAQDLAGPWRCRFDPSAAEGMPPHVTVLVPFKPAAEISQSLSARLKAVIAGFDSFRLRFARTRRFPGCLWLAPEPAHSVRDLTAAIVNAFPDCPPYGGMFAEVIPHLTVALGSEQQLDNIETELKRDLGTPIETEIHCCSLFVHSPGQWRETDRFPLS